MSRSCIGALLCLTLIAGCSSGGSTPQPPSGQSASSGGIASPSPSSEVWQFVSAPELRPMRVTVNRSSSATAAGLVFVAPYSETTTVGQPGALVLDDAGNPVYFHPTDQMILNFNTQTYRGEPVLTWWEGMLNLSATAFLPPGGALPGGANFVYDRRYCQVLKVTASGGWTTDEHEFLLTPQGTALLSVTRTVAMDLTPYGGPANGFVEDSAIQEVDLATGRVVFQWSMLDHVPLSESQQPVPTDASTSWDAYHLNSIDFDDDGHLLVSARDTWTIYQISHATGAIEWRLGGSASDFELDGSARFFWQHDARYRSGGRVSMYDDGCCDEQSPAEQLSHGLVLQLDLARFTAAAVARYDHDPPISVDSQGNLQALANGNQFVGWGNTQYYSEFTVDGTMIYDALMPAPNVSYRTFRRTWVGTPAHPPRAAARSTARGIVVYASWNGATQVARWQVLAGPTLLPVGGPVARGGFETAIPVDVPASTFVVQALDADGNVLGASEAAVLDGPPSRATPACSTP